MVVAHNLSAMNSNRQLSMVTKGLEGSTQRLSSGYRINKAADDAAGLSISEKMRKQIRGLDQAVENCEDGISMVQTADGALTEVHDMLQRMNELCIQAANGTNALSDRCNIQDEIDQLKTEIDRVSQTTKFNEINLLDGSIANPGSMAAYSKLYNRRISEVAQDLARDKHSMSFKALNGANKGKLLGIDDVTKTEGTNIIYYDEVRSDVATAQTPFNNNTGTKNNLPEYANLKQIIKNEILPQAVNAIITAYSPAFDYLKGSSIGMGLMLDGNGANIQAGTLAYVSVGYRIEPDQTMAQFLNFQLGVNTDYIDAGIDSSGNLSEDVRNKLEVTIVHEMIHAFMDEAATNGMIGVKDGMYDPGQQFPLWFTEGMAQTASGGYYNGNDFVNGSLGIDTSKDEAYIKAALGQYKLGGSDYRSDYGTGYLACMYLGYLAGGSNMSTSSIKKGLGMVMGDIIGGTSLAQIIKNLTGYTSISQFENAFANDGASFVKALTAAVGNGTGGVVPGDFTRSDDILPNSNPGQNMNLFELSTDNDTVINTYPAGHTIFAGGSGTASGASIPGAGGTGGNATSGGITPMPIPIPTIPVSPVYGGGIGAALHIGAEADMNNKLCVYIDAMDSESIGIQPVDVQTQELATLSIERVALAIKKVSAQRSTLGAYQNRLEHTVRNLGNVVENTTVAESRIRDTNMTKEMVKHAGNGILQQAGQSMLAQANQMNQGVLSLLSA